MIIHQHLNWRHVPAATTGVFFNTNGYNIIPHQPKWYFLTAFLKKKIRPSLYKLCCHTHTVCYNIWTGMLLRETYNQIFSFLFLECIYLGFSPVPIWQMIESIHMIWSRTMLKNLSLSVSVVICNRHSSQDVSSSFQHCITSCSRHAMASAFSPAYTVLSWAALSCSWRTWKSGGADFRKPKAEQGRNGS